jgi:WD40 repeat protein
MKRAEAVWVLLGVIALVPAMPWVAHAQGWRELGKHAGGVAGVDFSPDGKFLATVGGDRTIRIWDRATGKQVRVIKDPHHFSCGVKISGDGKLVAAAGYGGPKPKGKRTDPIRVWEMATGKCVATLEGHVGGGRRLAFFPNPRRLASAGFDGKVRIWDLTTGKRLVELAPKFTSVVCMTVSPDGKQLAVGDEKSLTLWDPATGKKVRSLGDRQPTQGVAFSPDGKLLAAGGKGQVSLWKVADGSQLFHTSRFSGDVPGVAFSSDGRLLFTGGYDHTIRLWEVASGKLIRTFAGHKSWVWCLALSPDDRTLASVGHDSRVLLWDVRPDPVRKELSGERLAKLWADLAGNAGRAYTAVWALASRPKESVPWLRECLAKGGKPAVVGATEEQIARWIKELDSDTFATRERATEALRRAGHRAEDALREAAKSKSLEVRRRCKGLLARLRPGERPSEELRAVRAVQALEYAGTDEARAVLEQLVGARGLLAEEAARAVKRLGPAR